MKRNSSDSKRGSNLNVEIRRRGGLKSVAEQKRDSLGKFAGKKRTPKISRRGFDTMEVPAVHPN